MPLPSHCPNPACKYHHDPPGGWYHAHGSYGTLAHGMVERFRCRWCRKTVSMQTESLHYYAKRRLPLHAVWQSFAGGACLREIARRYKVSPMAIQNGILRLGRQAMASHLVMLYHLKPRSEVVFDGLRSFVTSQDYPCDITAVVDRPGETIVTMTHTISCRGGRMTTAQKRRVRKKLRVWRPEPGTITRAISLVVREIWGYLRPSADCPATIDTDEHPVYASVLKKDKILKHFELASLAKHIQTPGSAARTVDNRLFPVNYVDRLLRHRVKEHTRETIAFGRHATMQMHRAWIFAWDHNCRREHRVKKPENGVHAEQDALSPAIVTRLNREFFTRRVRLTGVRVPDSIRRVWMMTIPTPPVRWRIGQKGTMVRLPGFAIRDLMAAVPQAC